MSEATFEAATVEQALEKAAAEMGVAADDLEHEVVEEKQDFWGGGDATVVIKAWRRADAGPEVDAAATGAAAQQEQEPAEPDELIETVATAAGDENQPAESADDTPAEKATTQPAEISPVDAEAPAAPGDSDAESESAPGVDPEAITTLLAQIFHDMEFDCTIEIEAEGDGYLATVGGEDKEALLEGNGRGLSALELIVNNAFRHKLPRGSKVSVDAGDFRSRRDEELSDLALQVAHSAKETGRTQETQPLNPYERRLVHLALAEDPQVSTLSRGSGFLKNVQIIPQDGDRGDKRRERHGE